MPETEALQIRCPNCGAEYAAQVTSVIDVGRAPELRQQLLSGQLNMVTCPKCGTGGVIEAPLVYHDPAAEFFAVYFPPQMNASEAQKQKLIGELTRLLMSSLPAEERKGYFLSPRQFVSRQSLLDAVLGTMGITQEELDRQRKKAAMVEQFTVMADDPKGLQMLVKEHDAQLDSEFFAILASVQQRAEAAGDGKSAERLTLLHDNLIELTTFGRRVQKQRAMLESLGQMQDADEFLERVIVADPDELTAVAVAARPMLDYAFFQRLSQRIESSRGPERERLAALRDRLLEMTEALDEAARVSVENATQLLQQIVDSPEPRSALRARAQQIDDLFVSVLNANIEQAEQSNDKALIERLAVVHDEVMALVEESMPPELRLINDLLGAEFPDGTRALLTERRQELSSAFLELMERMADDVAQRAESPAMGEGGSGSEIARRLRDIRAQAVLLA